MQDVILAALFACTGAFGEIEYRDKPCNYNSELIEVVPIKYKKTTAKQQKQEEIMLKKQLKALELQERRLERSRAQSDKAAEKRQLKDSIREAKCLQMQERIDELEDILRTGCKIRTYNSLKKKLAIAREKEREYCQD